MKQKPAAKKPRPLSREAEEKKIAKRKERFLAALSKVLMVTAAAKAAGVGRRTVYNWRDTDPEFAARLQDHADEIDDAIDAELDRRGRVGWIEPVFGNLGGKEGTGIVGEIRKFSDAALIFRAKTRPSGRFRERVELTGKNGGPMEHAITRIERAIVDPKQEGA